MTDSIPDDVGAGDEPADADDGDATEVNADEGTGDRTGVAAAAAQRDVETATERPMTISEDDGLLPPRGPIEPEVPASENALFVLLGVLGTIALLATAIFPGVI